MANADKETWWTKWLRNGRLSGLTFGVLLLTHIVFSILKIPTDGIQPLLLLAGGAFVGNIALKKESDDRAVNKRLDEVEKKVDNESTG